MRIAIDARMILDRPTGLGKYIANLINNILLQDTQNEYVVLANNISIEKELEKRNNMRVVYTKARPLTLTEHFVLPVIIRREKVDVFHAPSFVVPLCMPCKTLITLHDLTHIIYPTEFNKYVQFYYRIIVKHAVSVAKMIIADSQNTKKDIVRWARKPESSVRVIPLAAEDDYRVINDENALKQCRSKFKVCKPYIL
jgi:hypothetical protein